MLGFMRKVSPEEIYSMPLADVCAQIQISWAGDIACEVVMGERWTGGTGDFNSVDMMMKTLARHGYFADRLPLDPMNPFADPKIADAANNFADRVKSTTRRQISEHEVVIKAFRDALLEKGELNSAEIYGVLEEHGLHG
jgi:ATP-dependent Zn protease